MPQPRALKIESLTHRAATEVAPSVTHACSAVAMLLLSLLLSAAVALAQPDDGSKKPILLVDVDHRQQISLDGDWHAIVDPYGSGLYDFHGKLRNNGYFKNEKQ